VEQEQSISHKNSKFAADRSARKRQTALRGERSLRKERYSQSDLKREKFVSDSAPANIAKA
jgi:hypothetical protein